MQLSAVLLARVAFFVESVDLNPRGAAYYPDVVSALVHRYGFLVYPQKPEDFNEQKGVTLASGKLGDKVIAQVVIYNWGITLDTTSSTEEAEELLEEALAWSVQNLRLTYNKAMIKRKAYVSQLTFYSEKPLLSINPVLEAVGQKIGKEVTRNLDLPYTFEPRAILLGVDPQSLKIPIQVFSIERREGIAFSEGKYFSAAPVPTKVHLDVLSEFEKAVAGRTMPVLG